MPIVAGLVTLALICALLFWLTKGKSGSSPDQIRPTVISPSPHRMSIEFKMPDMGPSSPAIENQLNRLHREGLPDLPPLNREQASLLISSIVYCQSVFQDMLDTDVTAPPIITMAGVKRIIEDEDLRKYIIEWDNRRYRTGADTIKPRRHKHYEKVAEAMSATIREITG